MKKYAILIFIVLLIDQSLKFWIKTHMYLGQEYHIAGNWFIIHFTENNGMAFGMELFGKKFLSLFRIVVMFGLGWYVMKLIKEKANPIYITAMSLIFAGATGNIIDSIFYGKIFSSSEYQVAALFPPDGGYAGWLHGKVVDMFYFPLIESHFPDWFPVWGGEEFVFFRPVFNIADSAITAGVCLIILFNRTIFSDAGQKEETTESLTSENSIPQENQ
ncbi:MAG: lipoprotein signal peptidase [Bacteroidetes bacterium]|nr:lipoprotein signal peptidase [Bacteroidota bacterium]MCB8931185.1 lipoprotein signal peptidase [Bacteroidia bacterium]MCO5289055.1 lipoprotein signal peptidase [Bacteroidota bacterium]MCW5930361.1 lipoprotein signal peptidase [Bacteroidota bacterium]HRV53050.1 lipoprotein signal peptidase [Bacteroidia bacterium]